MIDATIVEISGAAAAISQTLPIKEQANLARAITNVEKLEDVAEPWRTQIETLISKKRNFALDRK